ncbi:MAG TPA: helix-turn-helix domain-containing protein [Chitinophagaceae bacterium]|nr:helix-turn-helix domain-containing protein [Chitinophagaceae bacterium]
MPVIIAGAELLTKEEAATTLKISVATLERLIKKCKLNSYKVGRRVLVSKVDLDTYLNQNYLTPTSKIN